jgi:DhnA family fructose-bisphosphate aldolase class Ia
VSASNLSSAVAAGKTRRFRRVVRGDGRSCLVAIDHAAYMGAGPPLDTMDAIAAGGPDAILATWNLARAHASTFADCGLVLRIDGGTSELGAMPGSDVSAILHTPEEALRIGADAVVILVFPGSADEERSLLRLARVASECELLGLPVMAESIPGGWGQAVEWSTENIARGARICVELGADIVKTVCPNNPQEFAAIVDACPAPVVALGGPKMASEDDVVKLARDVVAAGGAGIAFGRNVWGSPEPTKLVARLREAVHVGA